MSRARSPVPVGRHPWAPGRVGDFVRHSGPGRWPGPNGLGDCCFKREGQEDGALLAPLIRVSWACSFKMELRCSSYKTAADSLRSPGGASVCEVEVLRA